MKAPVLALRSAAVVLALSGAAAFAQGSDVLRSRVLKARDRVFPALVHIENVEEVFRGGTRTKNVSSGSGFFFDDQGHVITNYHVAGKAKRLFVTLANKTKVRAELIAGDPYTDVALIKVDPKKAWPDGKPVFARLGDSSVIEVGDFVMAMGSPLSLSRSISFGIVSCTDRVLGEMSIDGHATGRYNTWFQTDAAINPGNSGGPLVNLVGDVIGVNTRAGIGVNNIGFAIPINVVRDVVSSLRRFKTVRRASLGLTLQPLDEFQDSVLAGDRGVLVAGVANDSPAQAAGIRPGDLLVSIGEKPVEARFEEELPGLYSHIAALPINTEIPLTVQRGGKSVTVRVIPEALGRHLGEETEIKEWGITVRAITKRMAREQSLDDTEGVIVTGIAPGSAAVGKLEAQEVIRKIQGKPVRTLTRFRHLARQLIRTKTKTIRIEKRSGGITDWTVLKPASKSALKPPKAPGKDGEEK